METQQFSASQQTRVAWQCFTPLRDYVFAGEMQMEFPASGKMRLVRRGSILYYLTADASSNNFRLVTHRPMAVNSEKQLTIQADASDETAGVSFVIKNLNLRAAKLVK